MSVFDQLAAKLTASAAGHEPGQSVLASLLNDGVEPGAEPGLVNLVRRFEQAGLGGIVHSWIGEGANQEIEPATLQHVLGEDQVRQWAEMAGVPVDDLLARLAQFLPNAIDLLTPSGELPDDPQSPAARPQD